MQTTNPPKAGKPFKVQFLKLGKLYKFTYPFRVSLDEINGIWDDYNYSNINLKGKTKAEKLRDMGLNILPNGGLEISPVVSVKMDKYLRYKNTLRIGVYKKYNKNQVGTFFFEITVDQINGFEMEEV
jgi:hypothetical protein